MPLPRTPNTNSLPDGITNEDVVQYFTTNTYDSSDDGFEWTNLVIIFSRASIGPVGFQPEVISDAQLTQIYNKNIKSLLDQHLQNYLDNSTESEQGKQLKRDFFGNPQNYATILKSQNAWNPTVSGEVSISDYIFSSAPEFEPENYIINRNKFQQVNNENSNLIITKIFEEFLRTNPNRDLLVDDPDTTAELEEQIRDGDLGAVNARRAVAGLGRFDQISPQERRRLRQCALLSDVLHDGYSIDSSQTFSYIGFAAHSGLKPPYLGRIFPIKPDNFDPTLFVNQMISSAGLKSFFEARNPRPGEPAAPIINSRPNYLDKKIGFIYNYEDKNGNVQVKEFDLKLKSSELIAVSNYDLYALEQASSLLNNNNISQITTFLTQKGVTGIDGLSASQLRDKLGELIKQTRSKVFSSSTGTSNKFNLQNVKINFDGTNPSTARNDITVTLSFILSSITDLDDSLLTIADRTILREISGDIDADIRLRDLVTLPITGLSSGGPGYRLTNQYSPNYSRIRLKVKPGQREDKFNKTNLIADLTTIDHKISRESETGLTTFEISYRGYFESILNMPFNDALANKDIKANRKTRSERLNKAMEDKCDARTIRELLRVEQQTLRAEKETISRGSFITRLLTRGKFHVARFNQEYTRSGLILDPTLKYVDTIQPFTNVNEIQATSQSLQAAISDDLEKELEGVESILGVDEIYCVYLGDIMEVISDCLYKEDKNVMEDNVAHANLRFLVAPIQIPDPNDPKNLKNINPLQIPIDISLLMEWFHDTVVKKDLSYYPVGTFMRDLIERLLNPIIYETCFSTLLPDEVPPTLRVGFFNSTIQQFFEYTDPSGPDKGYYVDINRPFGNLQVGWSPGTPLFVQDSRFKIDTGATQPQNTTNYCVIYMQNPPFFREIKKNKAKILGDDPYVPRIVFGTRYTNYNYLSNVQFSKTDSPYLREARYFNTSYGNLSLLSNVYDLKFSFVDKKANTNLYPGMVLDFILKDWGSLNLFDSRDESDPHIEGTSAQILGLGGYFVVKSVSYNLGETAQDFSIEVSLKFLGSDGQPEARKVIKAIDVIAKDKKECRDAYTNAVRDYEALAPDGIKFAKVPSVSVSPANLNSTTTPATPVNTPNTFLQEVTRISTLTSDILSDAGVITAIRDRARNNARRATVNFSGNTYTIEYDIQGTNIQVNEISESGRATPIAQRGLNPQQQQALDAFALITSQYENKEEIFSDLASKSNSVFSKD